MSGVGFSGVSLNGKFDDIIKIDGKDVKANVKKLSDGFTQEDAKAYLEKKSFDNLRTEESFHDGYDTIGVSVGKENYLVLVKEDKLNKSDHHSVKLGNSNAKIEFIENESNSVNETTPISKLALIPAIGGAVGLWGTVEVMAVAIESLSFPLAAALSPVVLIGGIIGVGVGAYVASAIDSHFPSEKPVPVIPKVDETKTNNLTDLPKD